MSAETPSYTAVLADKRPWDLSVNFAIVQVPLVFDGRHLSHSTAVKTLVFEDVKDGDMLEPAFQLSHQQSQELFNSLWKLGFRPTDGTGNSGHVEALKNHLEDMRKLVFNAPARDQKGGSA